MIGPRSGGAAAGWSVLFDLGGVLLSWAPERAFARVLPAEQVADFMARLNFAAWNAAHDAGRPFAEGERQAVAALPEHEAAVLAYRRHFADTLTGMVPGTAAVVAELAAAGVGLAALTNWSAETFPVARARFGVLRRFAGVLVSGEEGVAKPDPAVFRLAAERFGLTLERTVFVDDSPRNVDAAAALGMTALRFTDAERLRADLVGLGLLDARPSVSGPLRHLVEAEVWRAAQAAGRYPWSTRGVPFDAEGFVHLSFPAQLAGVRAAGFSDVADADLLVLELDAAAAPHPVLVEDGFPHLFGELPLDAVEVGPYCG